MHIPRFNLCGLVVTLFFLPYCLSKDREYTIQIPAGTRSCFYEPVEDVMKEFEFEYQVIEGGELDINVLVQSPSGTIMLSTQRKSDGIHKLQASEKGDHMLCFDNSFSRITNKLVFFALIEETVGQSEEDWSKFGEELNLEVKVEDIRAAVANVRRNLERTIQLQNMLRVTEARDRATQEANFLRVNNWSMIQLIIMLFVGALQLFLIRSLFDEKSRFNQLFKRVSGYS